jgi:predicted PhzF superfamily epimerase YddE/YHI9
MQRSPPATSSCTTRRSASRPVRRAQVGRSGDLLELDLPAHAVEPGELPQLHDALGVHGDETFLGRAGNGAAIVMLRDEDAVRAVSPDFARLRTIDRLVIVTARGDEQNVASRVFAAYHGIDEDPVTGAALARWCRCGRAVLAARASRRFRRAGGPLAPLPPHRRPRHPWGDSA